MDTANHYTISVKTGNTTFFPQDLKCLKETSLCAEKKNVMLGVLAVEGSMNLPNLLENNLACHVPKNINNSVLVFLPSEPLKIRCCQNGNVHCSLQHGLEGTGMKPSFINSGYALSSVSTDLCREKKTCS